MPKVTGLSSAIYSKEFHESLSDSESVIGRLNRHPR